MDTPTRVLWVARTHDQLNHAVAEYKRLAERPVMSLRVSRERFCLHPDIKTAPDKATACEEATTLARPKHNRQPRGGSGCSLLDHAEKIGYPKVRDSDSDSDRDRDRGRNRE